MADPLFILLTWAAGLAIVGGVISLARLVGPGFTLLAGGTAGALALPGVFTSGEWWARVGVILVIVGLIWARNGPFAGVLLVVGGVFFWTGAATIGGWLPASTAAITLGAVTGEMMLGHWYLIDPQLPRWSLRALAVAGIVGLVADGLILALLGGLPDGGATLAFWVLLGTSVVLMVAVLRSLRYPSYNGVMAATGLSYLAVLTTLGSVFLGRALVAGLGPFTN